jgi:hypothetical protein
MGSENSDGCAQNAEIGFDFDFLEGCYKDGDKFLNHIVRVDETWVSFVNIETKRAVSVCEESDGSCFLGQKELLMVEFVQRGTTIKPEVYRKILKNFVGPFRAKGVEC